jgi:propanol-preferring alcohol dehydrogenase
MWPVVSPMSSRFLRRERGLDAVKKTGHIEKRSVLEGNPMTTHSSTYRAMQAHPEGSFELVQLPLVDPTRGEVRVAVEACGVCHSDIVGVSNLFGAHPEGAPVVPGHEIIGRIDALGAGVTGWEVGQRVGLGFLGGHCGVCAMCRRGDFVHCTDQPTMGDARDGGYAEYVTARASGLVAVPDGLEPDTAAPLLCAGVTVFNGLRNAGLRAGDLVAVQGIGGLGHLALQYARAMGYQVVAIARGNEKKALAEKLGARHYIDSSAGDVGHALQELGGAQAILATAASGASMTPLIAGLALHGRLVVVGAAPDPIEVDTAALIFGGRTIAGSLTGRPIENEENLAFSLAHDVRPMVEVVPLEHAGKAYEKMLSGAARFRMVVKPV